MGCNLLIRDGAIPVHDPDDLLETLELLLGNPLHPRAAEESGPVAAVDEYLASLGLSDTREALAEMGRRQAAGTIAVRDGLVREVMPTSGATDIGGDLAKGG